VFFARVFLFKIFYTDFLLCDANVAKYLVKIKENAPTDQSKLESAEHVSNTIILDNPEESTTSNEKSSNKFEKYSLEETNDKSVVERSHKMQIKGYLN